MEKGRVEAFEVEVSPYTSSKTDTRNIYFGNRGGSVHGLTLDYEKDKILEIEMPKVLACFDSALIDSAIVSELGRFPNGRD